MHTSFFACLGKFLFIAFLPVFLNLALGGSFFVSFVLFQAIVLGIAIPVIVSSIHTEHAWEKEE